MAAAFLAANDGKVGKGEGCKGQGVTDQWFKIQVLNNHDFVKSTQNFYC